MICLCVHCTNLLNICFDAGHLCEHRGSCPTNIPRPESPWPGKTSKIFHFFGCRQSSSSSFEQARVDWKIIRVVSEVVDEKLPYDKLPELRARMAEVPFSESVDVLLKT